MKKIILFTLVVTGVLFIYSKTDKSPDENTISEELKLWKENSSSFQCGTCTISYHDTKETSKETELLLHGYHSSSFDWNLVWNDLKKDYRLIAIDMLGFGFSGKPTVERYLKIVPNPNVIKLDGIGHFPQLEAPALIVKHFTNFIKSK